MSHIVFISYGSPDKPIAESVCDSLEQNGVPCWIAPRDISPGAIWGGEIIRAIEDARAMVLVFSSYSNESGNVLRELEFAVERHIPFVTFIIDGQRPTGPIRYFLGTTQWLDASSLPHSQHYPNLLKAVKLLTAQGDSPPPEPAPGAPSNEAWRHYSEGCRYYGGSSRQEMDWAEMEFQKALMLDLRFALPYVGLADVEIFRYMSYFERDDTVLARAQDDCRRALHLDSECADAHRSMGRVHMARREFELARESLAHAISIRPDFLLAHVSVGWLGIEVYDLEGAEESALAAQGIQKYNLDAQILISRVYLDRKEYHPSVQAAQDAVALDKKCGRAYYDLAQAYQALGKFDEARTNLRLSIELWGDPNAHVALGYLEMLVGEYGQALQVLEQSKRERAFAFLSAYYSGLCHRLRGDEKSSESSFSESLQMCVEMSKRTRHDPYPRVVAAMSAAALGDHGKADLLVAEARAIDPTDGLVAFYGACSLSWQFDRTRSDSLLAESLVLPRSPARIVAERDPHFTGSSRTQSLTVNRNHTAPRSTDS